MRLGVRWYHTAVLPTSTFPQPPLSVRSLRQKGERSLPLASSHGNASKSQMWQVADYLVNYSGARAIMDPGRWVDNIMVKDPINWLERKERCNIVCTTVGRVCSGYKGVKGVS